MLEKRPFRIKDHLKSDPLVAVFYNQGLNAYKPVVNGAITIRPNPQKDLLVEAEADRPEDVPAEVMFSWKVKKRGIHGIEDDKEEKTLDNRVKAWIAGYAVGAINHTEGVDSGFSPKPDYKTALAAIDALIGFDKLPKLTGIVQKIVHGYFGLPKK